MDKIKYLDKIKKLEISKKSYIYFYEIVAKKIEELKACFNGWKILYSIKANPDETILKWCYNNGLGFDASSISEIKLAKRVNENSYIQYSSPGKNIKDIEYCSNNSLIVIDSIVELRQISEYLKNSNKTIDIGLRLNIGEKNIDLTESMVGVESQFGIIESEIYEAIEIIKGNEKINFKHIHVYSGSQIMSSKVICQNIKNIALTVLKIIHDYNVNIKSINFGGGFGIPYSDEASLDLDFIKKFLESDETLKCLKAKQIDLYVESGRFIIAEAGFYITFVRDIKYRNGNKIVIVDGLMNTFFRPIFLNAYHHVMNLYKHSEKNIEEVVLCGNTCTPLDKISYLIKVPIIELNDCLVFLNAGAYGLSMSPTNFIFTEEIGVVYVE